MKVLTLHQPWASLVLHRYKQFETRSWPPPWRLIGHPLLIHAGKRIDREAAAEFCPIFGWEPRDLPRGLIIARATIWGAARIAVWRKPEEALAVDQMRGEFPVGASGDEFGDFAPGRWVWSLGDIRPIEPQIPARGRQGLWDFDYELRAL